MRYTRYRTAAPRRATMADRDGMRLRCDGSFGSDSAVVLNCSDSCRPRRVEAPNAKEAALTDDRQCRVQFCQVHARSDWWRYRCCQPIL